MPEPLAVDPFFLERAGITLQSQVLPVPPPPIVAEGSDAASEAINVTMPIIEAPVNDGLPAAQVAIKATGSKLAAAARMYAETDQRLGKKLNQVRPDNAGSNSPSNGVEATFRSGGTQSRLASPSPDAPHPAAQAPASEFHAQPPSSGSAEDSPVLTAAPDGPGPSTWDVADNELSASLNPDAPDEFFNSTGWTDPGDADVSEAGVRPEAWEGSDDTDFADGVEEARPDLDSWGDPENPAGQDTFTDQDSATDSLTDQLAPDNEQLPAGLQGPADPATDEGALATQPATAGQPGPEESGTGTRTSDDRTKSGDPKTLGDTTPRSRRPEPMRAQSLGATGKGRMAVSQPGGGASGGGVPQSLTGLTKPSGMPHAPAAGHAHPEHHPAVTPASAPGQHLPPASAATGGRHAAPLSPSTPPGPSQQLPTPHLSPPAAPAAPSGTPASMPPGGGGIDGGTGAAAPPMAPGGPPGPSRPVAPAAAKDGGTPDGDAGPKPPAKSPTPPPVSKDGATAGTPVSAARAERDAIAEATAADARRRNGADPLQLARRIAAALNAPDTRPERHFGFYWVTGVTTSGAIVIANNYGMAYLPDGIQLPEPVHMASADDAIPLTDRVRWITYPMVAVKGWADHRDEQLRAVIATAEQFGESDPGVTKVVLEPDDIPTSGKMTGRSRLAVVDPQAAERLASTPDQRLANLLPPAGTEAELTDQEQDMLWVEVTTPLLSDHPSRQAAHLRAFMIYSAEAEESALRRAHGSTDSPARRKAVADWLYWNRIIGLLRALLQEAQASSTR